MGVEATTIHPLRQQQKEIEMNTTPKPTSNADNIRTVTPREEGSNSESVFLDPGRAEVMFNMIVAPNLTNERLSKLIGLVKEGVVSLQPAKRVYPELVAGNEEPRAVADRLGLIQVGDANTLGAWVAEVLAANPSEVERFRGGEAKLMGFFVGLVMKKSGGKADPKALQPLLTEKLRKK